MSEPLAEAILTQLIRARILGDDDVDAIAAALEADGESDAAHQARVCSVEAVAPTQSDWQADQRRSRFRVIGPADGGNPPT